MKIDLLSATATRSDALLSRETQVLSRGHTANSVSMPLATSPSLYADDHLALFQDAEVDGLLDTPLQATIDILLPVGFTEVGLLLGKKEWIDTAVQVRILPSVSTGLD